MAGQNIGKAYVQIMPSVKGLGSNLKAAMSGDAVSAGDSAGESLGNSMVGKIKGIIVAAGIGAAIKSSLDEGGALQQSLGGVETLFKENADTVKEYANNAYKTAGMSANEYMETVTGFSASLLQSLGGDTAKAAESADMALTDMSDNANKFGTDMESIKNAYSGFAKQNYTMLDNLKLGYGGTKQEMERLLADAQKISGVEYNIDSLDDVYQAIHVIQGELGVTGTTAKEAASTLSGSAASMKAAFTNVLGKLSIGEDISNDLNALGESVQTFLFDNIIPMLGNIAERIPQILSGVGAMLIKGLNKAASGSGGFAESFVSLLSETVESVVEMTPYVLEAFLRLIASIGEQFLNMDWNETIQTMLANLRDILDIAAMEILGTDGNIIESLISAITEGLPVILEQGRGILSGIIQGITDNLPELASSAAGIMDTLVGAVVELLPVLLDNGVQIVTEIANGIMQNLPTLIEGAGQISQSVLTAILELIPDIMQAGFDLVSNLAAGLMENGPEVLSSITEVLGNLIQTLVDHLPEIMEKGKEILSNVAKGILDNLPELIASTAEIIAGFLAEIASHLPDILESGIKLLGELIAGIIKSIPDVISAAGEIIDNIVEEFSKFDWIDIGKNIIEGIADGVRDVAGHLIDAAVEVVGDAWNGIKGFLGIASPSKKAHDVIGKNWVLGIGGGFIENFPETEMLSSVQDAFKSIQNEVLGIPVSMPRIVSNQFDNAFDMLGSGDSDLGEILNAINGLKEAIMNLKIVMDSGEIVGAIYEGTDERMGEEAQHIEWQ